MRTYGRVYNSNGTYTWVEVQTDANGLNDYVYATALIQELKLNLGESPFWGTRGIPAKQSVLLQIAPDYYTFLVQKNYAKYFLSLIISRNSAATTSQGYPLPTYQVNITTHNGVQLELNVPV